MEDGMEERGVRRARTGGDIEKKEQQKKKRDEKEARCPLRCEKKDHVV